MVLNLGSRCIKFLMPSFWKWISHCIFKSHVIIIIVFYCQYLFRFTYFLLVSDQDKFIFLDKYSSVFASTSLLVTNILSFCLKMSLFHYFCRISLTRLAKNCCYYIFQNFDSIFSYLLDFIVYAEIPAVSLLQL